MILNASVKQQVKPRRAAENKWSRFFQAFRPCLVVIFMRQGLFWLGADAETAGAIEVSIIELASEKNHIRKASDSGGRNCVVRQTQSYSQCAEELQKLTCVNPDPLAKKVPKNF